MSLEGPDCQKNSKRREKMGENEMEETWENNKQISPCLIGRKKTRDGNSELWLVGKWKRKCRN